MGSKLRRITVLKEKEKQIYNANVGKKCKDLPQGSCRRWPLRSAGGWSLTVKFYGGLHERSPKYSPELGGEREKASGRMKRRRRGVAVKGDFYPTMMIAPKIEAPPSCLVMGYEANGHED